MEQEFEDRMLAGMRYLLTAERFDADTARYELASSPKWRRKAGIWSE